MSGLTVYTARREVLAPAPLVWARLSDVTAWPAWLPTFEQVTPTTSVPLQLGARYRVRQPGLKPLTWDVTSISSGRSFSWAASTPGVRLEATHAVEPTGPAACHVVLGFRVSGPLRFLVTLLLGRTIDRYLNLEADTLARRATEDAARRR